MVSNLLFSIVLIATLISVEEWQYEFEKEGITVYTKEIEGSNFDAFKGEMQIEATIDELLDILLEIEKYPEWCYKTSSTNLLKEESNKLFYYYISETPIGIKDREAYFVSEINKNADTGEILITMNTFQSENLVPNGFIRMPLSTGFWKLTPTNQLTTKVLFQMHADPGGSIPAWLANLASTESPYITLNNLRKIVKEKR